MNTRPITMPGTHVPTIAAIVASPSATRATPTRLGGRGPTRSTTLASKTVDEEHAPPPERLGEQAADRRTQGETERRDRGLQGARGNEEAGAGSDSAGR